MQYQFPNVFLAIKMDLTFNFITTIICILKDTFLTHCLNSACALYSIPLQSLKIIFVKSTLVLLAMQFKLRREWIGGGLSLKNPHPTIMLRAICIILLLRKKSLPEFKSLTKLLHLVHIYLHMYIQHEQRDQNAQSNNRKLFCGNQSLKQCYLTKLMM